MAKAAAPAVKAKRTITVTADQAGVAFMTNQTGGHMEDGRWRASATKISEGKVMLTVNRPGCTWERALVAIPDTVTLEVIEEE